jgi:hypothetical protein
MEKVMLDFEYVGNGKWQAKSFDGFSWMITICADGEFVVSGSDRYLLRTASELPTFLSYGTAVLWCQLHEQLLNSSEVPNSSLAPV